MVSENVPDCERPVVFVRDVDDLPRVVAVDRQRLFDEHVDAGFEQIRRDPMVCRRRGRNCRRLDAELRQALVVGHASDAVTRSEVVEAVLVEVTQDHVVEDAFLGQLGGDANVVAPPVARADDGVVHW